MGYSDPFGLDPCKDRGITDVFVCVGLLLSPVQKPLEVAGAVVLAPIVLAAGAEALGAVTYWSAAGTAAPAATNPALRRTLSALFQRTDRIAGGTAGAIRNETLTGRMTGGSWHLQKGLERAANLRRILSREQLSAKDRETAQRALAELDEAVRFARENNHPASK